MTIQTIAAAIDFSANSRDALRIALDLAAQHRARVVAVNALDLLLVEAAAVAYDDGRLREETQLELRRFVEAECRGPAQAVAWDVDVRVGRPAHEILAAAAEQGADLVVMGTHGLGAVRKLFFGSTAEKVLRESTRPVLAVPPANGEPRAPRFARVVAAVDLDESAGALAKAAEGVAQALGVPMTLVHVVRPIQMGWRWAEGRDACLRIPEARRQLEAVARDAAVRADVLVLAGEPEEQIAATASQQPGTLVIVGLGGEAWYRRPGTTAYRILCLATAPVLALPIAAPGEAGR